MTPYVRCGIHWFHINQKWQRGLSGALLQTQRMGVRLSPASGGSNVRAVALLYDSENRDLLCVMPYPVRNALHRGDHRGCD